jgi:anti-anti-sigma factor
MAMAPPCLSFTVDRRVGGTCLAVFGEVDMGTADQLVAKASALLDEAPADLTLDFAGITFLDSAGVKALVSIYQHAFARGCKLTVTNLRPHIRHVLEITRLDEILTLDDPVEVGDNPPWPRREDC